MHLLRATTHDVHRARNLSHLHVRERDRFRHVVERIDTAIERCEEAHLLGFKRMDDRLRASACAAINLATRVVGDTKDQHAICRVARNAARAPRTISDLMDCLWEIEDAVFDLMIPGRARIDDTFDVDEHDEDDTVRIVRLLSSRPVGSAA